jgi:hypothetical protein
LSNSIKPWACAAFRVAVAFGQQGGAGDQHQVPAQSEQQRAEQKVQLLQAGQGYGGTCQQYHPAQHGYPSAAEAIHQGARQKGREEHAEHVPLNHLGAAGQAKSAKVHGQGRSIHHQDHQPIANRRGGDRRAYHRAAQQQSQLTEASLGPARCSALR